MLLANSDELENKLADGNGRIQKMIDAKLSTPAMVEELYLAALSRYPTPKEIFAMEAHIQQSPELKKGSAGYLNWLAQSLVSVSGPMASR